MALRLYFAVAGALSGMRDGQTVVNVEHSLSASRPRGPRHADLFSMCGTPDVPLCPKNILESFPSITLHHEDQLWRLRDFDKIPYLAVLLYTAFRKEDIMCSEAADSPFVMENPKVVIYDGEASFEIAEPKHFNDFSSFAADYTYHVTAMLLSFLPRIYFVFTSEKCRNKLFVLKNVQFPPIDPHTTVTRITGNSRNAKGWISLDDWAREERSIDLQAPMIGTTTSQYDTIRKSILHDLKNFIAHQVNGSLIDYNLRISESKWDVPLCDPTGKNGKKCSMPIEISRHAMWPTGFIGDDRTQKKADFIDGKSTLHLETQHLTKELSFLRRNMCKWVKDKLRRSPHDRYSNNCVASAQPRGARTSITYDLSKGDIDDVVIWDISTAIDGSSRSSFNFSSYTINVHELANLQFLPEAGIYRVHSVKNRSMTWQRGVRKHWRVLAIDHRQLINAKYEVQADINHPFDFNKIRSIEPMSSKGIERTITFENPDVVQNPSALLVKMYCFAFENVVYNRTQYDRTKLPAYCSKRICKWVDWSKCKNCHPKAVDKHLTALTKSIAQAMPNHFDNLLLPQQLLPSEKECGTWLAANAI
eukprot:GEMP01005663.1.p1 GENE.GEMP01005663.1~~GEMP01005663.1.p1  ORF type:complete len:630 (+),score=122.13 GEMP01005663.1:124-1890(+)